ncbi:MAG: bifunctional 5,10-methylene-tetrahydrofolate dehydrogenase/5,10-methylene-tetrahydrofolate cyclohydrolase [Bacteroidetes bacterium]|jgi:methylenetetrahydrofolate dehydrogenase (NADP+)/methenyltetrahydrofolate cyclohydrolase|nr:bifunctional 5,10-methylene-tetrahydrofolate dehydrogenase/5,10-methylene-tetrahydrofolate cyclohydrolase [Bacteroidota bacterium]MBK9355410.1 bifunctional 5,10-methylene-tetrahydrofolate dehydrogenase/5,10-methylene-tetrahydrofolate cyclohydrolase [Bacteroidota bacterium]MBL0079828.1 bifunctional 5,10-methylene-tetrahydrofolate dehydrogenase/5,10-methylene-tetrahydrofolate cyclohydrolase [Bacteroidota bacterium]
MAILDGKLISNIIKNEIAEEVQLIKLKNGKTPCLAAILVGNDGASETYVASKVKSCEEVGFQSELIRMPSDTTEAELLFEITKLNNDPKIDGFIVQLPLPKHINEQNIIQSISIEKDVDGFHPTNMGKLVQGLPSFIPATPFGIIQLLERYKIETEGKNCVVLGRSNIVGTPMAILMSRKGYPGNCTVTICHSKSKNLETHLLQADIIIAALGIPEFLKGNMVKAGAVVIDVGITRVKDEQSKKGFVLKGDVKFDEVAPKCSFISPVPGGVGLMTVTSLLMNTLKAAKNK